jgi:predicted nucleotidyltransferase
MTHHNRILGEIRRLAQQLFANIPASAYLYGSRARGDADDDSDWDILIVTDDSVSAKDAFEKFAFPFTEIGWQLGEQITPLLYTRSEWDAERNTSFYLNVKQDSIPL